MEKVFYTAGEAETEQVGARLAEKIEKNTVVAMRGDLGAGKTVFVRGFAKALGYTGRVTSPTFTIVNEYDCDPPVFHFDMYRLSDSEDLYGIGWDDYLRRGGVCIVEWSERVEDALEGSVTVTIERLGDKERKITIKGIDL
ncbi:MAG: tRNA (adenosine(37)-N6)-threonylcarbamoyltransferase complex ATPase subunit type 1 TsaE [Oscillospiraceae bacterium]|nr:tRNA (adenosine(37)-N6)-threonylcarbamoyltransferase complex ATPase subunit type 1 TsaE [Oscillospiraceae bacterium]